MKAIIHRSSTSEVYLKHTLVFEYEEYPGHTIDFPCGKLGAIHLSTLSHNQYRLWQDCLSGYAPVWKNVRYDRYWAPIPGTGYLQSVPVINRGISTITKKYVVAGTVECVNCCQDVVLYSFFNVCQCGLKYNQVGNLLGAKADWTDTQRNNLVNLIANDPDEMDFMMEVTSRMKLETLHFDRIKHAHRR